MMSANRTAREASTNDQATDQSTSGQARERRAWQAPAFTELAVATGTKSAIVGRNDPTHPKVPTAPMTKIGFSFEVGFPLSSRTEK
jgi:hypothetical protein